MRNYSYHMRLQIYSEDLAFGPGVAMLMENVEETGSLSKACKKMEMAYSKGWKILKRAEKELGCEMVHGTRGGSNGGKMVLTKEGKEWLEKYRTWEQEANKAVGALFQKYIKGENLE